MAEFANPYQVLSDQIQDVRSLVLDIKKKQVPVIRTSEAPNRNMTTNQDFTQSSGVNKGKSNKFYNTIGATGHELKKFQKQAETQEAKVLAFLRSDPNDTFTKHEIKTNLVRLGKIHERTPESSISRALSDLMNKGKVIKLDKMRLGEFDKPNHLWQVMSSNEAQSEIF